MDYYPAYGKRMLDDFSRLDLWPIVEPRRYVPPHGYLNPKFNSLSVASTLVLYARKQLRSNVEQVSLAAAWKLLEASMPTIFVAEDFLRAICITDPPEDMKLSELHWPFNAVTFVLPQKFQDDYFGVPVPFIRTARLSVGTQRPPESLNQFFSPRSFDIYREDDHKEMFCIWTTSANPEWSDYTGTYPLAISVKEMLSDKYEFTDHTTNTKNNPSDVLLTRKSTALTVHLLLAMNAVPDFLVAESISRPQKERKGIKVQDALWHPSTFGFSYRMKSKEKVSQGGTHASPRLHPRRGHWRNQRYGKQLSQTKVIWIEPVLVGTQL